MRPFLFFLGATVIAATTAAAPAAAQQWSSGPGRTSLIELYTSEGCSSCPPAERWLATQALRTFIDDADCVLLVNNAGIQHVAPIEEFPVDRWDDILAVNLSAAFHTIRLTLPAMRAAGWGRIVNIASAHGLVASTEKVAYIAAKHGLVGLTKTVALETAQSAITCNAICPGWVLTPLTRVQIQRRADEDGMSFDEAAVALILRPM